MKIALLAALFLLAGPPPRVAIHVLPQAVMVNENVRVTCTVPKHPDNRQLTIGIPGYTTSDRQLDGDAAPITHVMLFQHVPCDVDTAICAVVDSTGKVFAAAVRLQVGGCRAPDDLSPPN